MEREGNNKIIGRESHDDELRPPPAPEINRRITFKTSQWIGIPFILLLPMLALFQVTGPVNQELTMRGERVLLQVTYPERTRYSLISQMQISVTNTGIDLLPSLRLGISRSYLENFYEMEFLPRMQQVSDEEYMIEFTGILPGESRSVVIEFRPVKWGIHRGSVAVSGTESIEGVFSTFVLP